MRISDWSSDVCSSDLYLDYLAGGGNPDQFAGLPGGGPIDPGQPDPNQPAGTNMRGSLSFAVPGANSHTSLYARDVVFVDGKPSEIPTGSTLIPTDRGNFAEIYENDAITIGRLHDGVFTDRSEKHTSELQSLIRIS